MNFLFSLMEELIYLMWEVLYISFNGILRAVISVLAIIFSLFSGHHF